MRRYIHWAMLIIIFGSASLLFSFSFNAMAAALIGAGIPAVYYVYLEKVKLPSIDFAEHGVKYRKNLLLKDNQVYPVIHAYIVLKNEGIATAKDCFGVLKAKIEDSIKTSYGRWGGPNEQSIDFHPSKVGRRLVFMRFFPAGEKFISKLNKKLNEENAGYSVGKTSLFNTLCQYGKEKE